MRGRRRRALVLAVAVALACGRAEPERPAARPADAMPGAASSPPSAEPPLPPEGGLEVRFGADGILALANQAPRHRVLEALARETGLIVVAFVEGGDPDGPVTIQSRGEPIEVVLARALVGVPFSVEPLEGGARERLTVVVGRTREAAPVARAPGAEPPEADPREPAERARRLGELEGQALEQIASPDPRERAEGVEWADVTSAMGFEAVVERLANDPDGTVRAAAAESLGGADVGAVRPLLEALADPDPRVVLAALESLELLGDESIVPELAPALEHRDATVRERAAEASDFLAQ